MDDFLTRHEHSEFAKRIDEENERQNKRLTLLEQGQIQINELVSNVKVLAVNMDNMVKEQAKQGERLKEIEGKPAKRWDTVIACIITAIVTMAINALINGVFK